MKMPWMAYVVVAVLSIGAGVAIAGLPTNVEVDATIIPPVTTDEPGSTTTSAVTTTPASTEPEPTQPESTDAQPTDPQPTDPESTDPDPTAPDTSDPTGTTEPELVLPDRSEIVTVTANGAAVGGTATRWSELLEGLGYVDVQPLDGTLVVDLSVVYHADGFEGAALRLAEDMALLPEFVAPLAEAPEVLALPDDVQLLAYVGLDRT